MLAAIAKPETVKEALNYVLDVTGYVALGLTIALIAILAAIGVAIKAKKKPELMASFKKVTIGTIMGYSIAIIFSIGTLGILKSTGRGKKYITLNSDWFWGLAKDSKGGMAQLYIYMFIIVIAMVLLAVFVGKKHRYDKTKSIVYGAILIALSFALSYVKFLSLPQGGSITFASLVPLMIYSYMFGIRRGLIAAVIYGVLQFFQAPYFVHPAQFLLDYPIGFGAIGLTGLLRERQAFKSKQYLNFAFGALIAVTFRYFSHVISGIFVFGSGDPSNYGAVAWSFLYNSFAFADLAVALVAGISLLLSKSFTHAMEQSLASMDRDAVPANPSPALESAIAESGDATAEQEEADKQ